MRLQLASAGDGRSAPPRAVAQAVMSLAFLPRPIAIPAPRQDTSKRPLNRPPGDGLHLISRSAPARFGPRPYRFRCVA
jgi:hypothetical protein